MFHGNMNNGRGQNGPMNNQPPMNSQNSLSSLAALTGSFPSAPSSNMFQGNMNNCRPGNGPLNGQQIPPNVTMHTQHHLPPQYQHHNNPQFHPGMHHPNGPGNNMYGGPGGMPSHGMMMGGPPQGMGGMGGGPWPPSSHMNNSSNPLAHLNNMAMGAIPASGPQGNNPGGPLGGGMPSQMQSQIPHGMQHMNAPGPGGGGSGPNPMFGMKSMPPASASKLYPPGQPLISNPLNPNAPPIYPCGSCRKEVNDNEEAVF
uniref:Uncharacterized protein n=1 Tax=Megaselia scalaris TaxID=36166 RepID=T1GAQ9_MEGSC